MRRLALWFLVWFIFSLAKHVLISLAAGYCSTCLILSFRSLSMRTFHNPILTHLFLHSQIWEAVYDLLQPRYNQFAVYAKIGLEVSA